VRDTNSCKRLKAFFGSTDIAHLRRRDIEQYVATRKAAKAMPGTMNRELSCLKNMLRKAVDWEYLDSNPAWGVRQQREETPQVQFLTEDEADRLLANCSPTLRAIVAVALHTGMRRGEILNLRWQDITAGADGRILITVRKSKNHDSRHIPVNPILREALGFHRNSCRTPKGEGTVSEFVFCRADGEGLRSVRNGYEAAVKRAGIGKHIRFHDLRHTFASWLVMKGIDLRTVAQLMGHRDIRVTMRYAHLAPAHLQSAVDVLAQPRPGAQRAVV
jgi:site-specific recombinase XerD